MADERQNVDDDDVTRTGTEVEWRDAEEAPVPVPDDDDDPPRTGTEVEWRDGEQKKEEETDTEDDPVRG